MPLLISEEPSVPFNHSREVSVAARNGRVVVAAIHEHFASDTSYDPGPNFRKRVSVNVSDDAGKTFGAAVNPMLSDQSADPVVRVADDGTFFLSALVVGMSGDVGAVARSRDGTQWMMVASDLAFGDKEWLAIDSAKQEIYVVAREGGWRFSFDGALLGMYGPSPTLRPLVVDAYATEAGVYFATGGTPNSIIPEVYFWDGSSTPPVNQLIDLDPGPLATVPTTISWSRGPLEAGTWSVRAVRRADGGPILLRLEDGPTETPITDPGTTAFLPTATMDGEGRIHLAWYDSSGPSGVVRYSHSIGDAPFIEGFIEPIEIDNNACPGNGWYPDLETASGGRRLREYIGLAVDGDMVHIAWTHSPSPPSRVYAAALQLRE